MIPQIQEINLPSYATLCKATVTLNDMGEKTITSQVSIDGQITPDFSFDWEVHHMGEKFIMPLRQPQASKENTSLASKIDLTFQHWAIYQLKRWYFFTLQSYEAGVAVADKYIASVSLNLKNFCDLYGQMLNHYFGDKITIDLNPDWVASEEPIYIDINHSYLWDVLIKLYELFAVRWEIVPNGDPDHYTIKVGYPVKEMNHIFEYGFEGGLLKVERQVQDDNIRNMLLGRGGDKNIPYLYFKKADPSNPTFQADPDWVEELANVYFDRLRSAEFRSYIQGWKAQHISKYPGYTAIGESNAVVPWAYRKGYTDTKFDPVEYVKDDESIRKYGELLGGLDDNDEIYPSIQGVVIDPLGRIDQVVDVEQVTGDILTEQEKDEVDTWSESLPDKVYDFPIDKNVHAEIKITFDDWKITVPEGYVANVGYSYVKSMFNYSDQHKWAESAYGYPFDVSDLLVLESTPSVVAMDGSGKEIGASGIPQGTYQLAFYFKVHNSNQAELIKWNYANFAISNINVQFGLAADNRKNQVTFDIWIKNIWQTTKNANESNEAYAERVWKPILGNHLGDEAAVCFSSGLLSTSEDYTFLILGKAISKGIHYDTSKSLNGVQSHWRLTLVRSDADYDSLGKLVPNLERQGKAGDYFYFTGIELTHYYVKWAEKRLHDYKLDQLGKVSDIQPSWVVSLDKVRIGTPHYEETQSLLSQLHIGGSVRIADKRFIGGSTQLYLYLQQITYKYNESQNTANITPNVEVVLGTDYQTTANPVATIQSQIDAIHNQIGGYSTSNIQQIVRMVGDRIYLRKDGITDRSQSITYFAELLAALGFRQGMVGGYGWGFYQDENGKWVLETDRLNVRDEMQVNTLVINQIQARGGMIIESAASIEASDVEDTTQGYKVYFDTKHGSLGNLFRVDDVAYCHRYTPENQDLKYYKRRVIEIGEDYITLSKTIKDGQGIPAEGDVIVHFGNYTDKERQYVIVRDVMGGGYERMLSGLNSVTATGDEYYFAGYQSSTGERFFIGTRKDNQYIEYINGKLYIPGQLILGSDTGGGKTMLDYIKENGGLSQDEIEKIAQEKAKQAQKEAQEYADAVAKAVGDDLQKQIDGQIETWYSSGVPTLNNYPANEWKTNNDKDIHIGDLYYDKDSGYAYRFMLEGDTYKWVLIQDTDIAKALATANSKRRIFTDVPYPPYDANDLWVNATYPKGANKENATYYEDILVCKTARLSGTFNISDWGLASDYISEADLDAWGALFQEEFSQEIKGQLDGKAETWYQPTDPSLNWKDDATKKEHIGDLWFNTTNNTTWYWNGTEWKQQNVPDEVFDKIDGKADIFVSKPLDGYHENDLWFLESEYTLSGVKYDKGTLVVATNKTPRKAGEWFANDWTKKDKYTDDTYAHSFDYLSKALNDGRTEIGGGLILSSLIALGTWDGSFQTIYSGINGQPLTAKDDPDYIKKGLGIAAWYGGEMWDIENDFLASETRRYAQSLFRFDGSGYLAGGNITWKKDGSGSVGKDSKGNPVISWDSTGVTLSDTIKLGTSSETLSSILTFMNKMNNMFTLEENENGTKVIRANYDGFYSYGFVSAKGKNDEGGASGGILDFQYSGSGNVVTDVKKSGNIVTITYGNVSQGLDTAALASYLASNNYAKKSDITWDGVSGKPSWIGATKPSYSWGEINGKPTTLSGYGILDELNGLYVKKSGDTMTGKLTVNSQLEVKNEFFLQSGILNMGAEDTNIFYASGSAFRFVLNGEGASITGSYLDIFDDGIYGKLNNGSNLGSSARRWNGLYSVTGDFATSVKIGGATLTWDGTALKINTGFYSESFISAKGKNDDAGGGGGGGFGQYLTLQRNGVKIGDYNGSEAKTINISVPTNTNELTNGAGFLTSSALGNYVTLNTDQTITGIKTFSPTTPGGTGCTAYFNNATSGGLHSWIYIQLRGVDKTSMGYYNNFSYVANETTLARIGVNDAGNPEYWPNLNGTKYTLLHSGNYTSYINPANYVLKSGDTMTGTLTISTNGTGDCNQGIRINRTAASNWATLTIGYVGNATWGTSQNMWLIATPANSNSLIFNLNNASESIGLCLKGNGISDMKWNNNTVWHAGNDGSGSGLDADLLDGQHETVFLRQRGTVDNAYYDGTTYSNLLTGIYQKSNSGSSAMLIHFQNIGSTSGFDIYTNYPQTDYIFFRKTIDSNRFAATAWSYFITNHNIGSQSVNYATNAGNADTVDGYHATALFRQFAGVADYNFADNNNNNGIYYIHTDTPNNSGISYGGLLNLSNNAFNSQLRMSNAGALAYRYRWWSGGGNSWSGWQTIAFTSSNVASATQLQTTRYIWGQAFNGTGNVSGNMTGVGSITFADAGAANFDIYGNPIMTASAGSWNVCDQNTQAPNVLLTVNRSTRNVGIGTLTPSSKLHVVGTGYFTSSLTVGGNVESYSNVSADGSISAGENLNIAGNSTLQGGVSIGTTTSWSYGGTPSVFIARKVKFSQNVFFQNGTLGCYLAPLESGDLCVYVHNNGSYVRQNSIFYYNGTFFNNAGMYSNGYVSAKGQNTSSDLRLKTELRPLNLELAQIANAPSVLFKWKKDGSEDFGSVAQYWQSLNPLFARKDFGEHLTLDYGKLALTSVIEVAKKTLSHEQRIKALERRIKELEKQLGI